MNAIRRPYKLSSISKSMVFIYSSFFIGPAPSRLLLLLRSRLEDLHAVEKEFRFLGSIG